MTALTDAEKEELLDIAPYSCIPNVVDMQDTYEFVESIIADRTAALEAERDEWRQVAAEQTRMERDRADKAEAERDKWEKSAEIWEQEAVDLLADRNHAERALAALRARIETLAGQMLCPWDANSLRAALTDQP